MPKLLAVLMVVVTSLMKAYPARVTAALEVDLLRGPVTALHVTGNRVLIGQQTVLIEAQFSNTGLHALHRIPINRRTIRAITSNTSSIFVLSEDGVTLLTLDGVILDFVPGGGQQISTSGDRVYVAALQAGVRVMRLDPAGKLTPLAILSMTGPAYDVMAESPTLLRVAEGERGIRLYDVQNIAAPNLLGTVAVPATVMQRSADKAKIYVGSASKVAILAGNPSEPMLRLLGTHTITGLVYALEVNSTYRDQVFVGRIGEADENGPDVLLIDFSSPAEAVVRGQYGESGRGEHMALYDSDLLVGSVGRGLRWLHFEGGVLRRITLWEVDPAVSVTGNLVGSQPDKQVANQAKSTEDASVNGARGWLATPVSAATISAVRLTDTPASTPQATLADLIAPALCEIAVLALVLLVGVLSAERRAAKKAAPPEPQSQP